MTYTWLLFDADGTLFDYDRAEATALEQAFAECGTEFDSACLNTTVKSTRTSGASSRTGGSPPNGLRLRRFELLFEALRQPLTPAAFSPVYLRHLAGASHLMDGARRGPRPMREVPPRAHHQRAGTSSGRAWRARPSAIASPK